MPKEMLSKISFEKKSNLKKALIDEFSHYSVSDSQVARIVQQANISRGSFYTYFEDLYDSYEWVFEQVMSDVHQEKLDTRLDTAIYFIEHVQDNPYREFLKKYYEVNKSLLSSYNSHKESSSCLNYRTGKYDALSWVEKIVIHESIKEAFITGTDSNNEIISRLKYIEQWLKDKEV
ncbi:TetR/AcrR family transcriptional regulator [Weissella cibaria]|uniref:TetR/AcrR family transcriptional regulator n=1 Tax=Weissella cibaria TaxID=137591 RepID=UPI00106E5030|nr:TetR/AcrR family transcriptional regulator [Weissella cibaria]